MGAADIFLLACTFIGVNKTSVGNDLSKAVNLVFDKIRGNLMVSWPLRTFKTESDMIVKLAKALT